MGQLYFGKNQKKGIVMVSSKDILKLFETDEIMVDINQVNDRDSFESMGVDSLELAILLSRVEREFYVSIPTKNIASITNINDLVKFINQGRK